MKAGFRKGLIREIDSDNFAVLGFRFVGIPSVFVHAEKAGHKPVSRVRSLIIEPANIIVAKKLGLSIGEPVYRFVRTRIIDDKVIANQTNFIPLEICPGLEENDFSNNSFQILLEQKYHTMTVEGNETFRLDQVTDEDIEVMGMKPGDNVIEVQRIATSTTEMPIVWAIIRINPKHYHYVQSLWPQAVELVGGELLL